MEYYRCVVFKLAIIDEYPEIKFIFKKIDSQSVAKCNVCNGMYSLLYLLRFWSTPPCFHFIVCETDLLS